MHQSFPEVSIPPPLPPLPSPAMVFFENKPANSPGRVAPRLVKKEVDFLAYGLTLVVIKVSSDRTKI